MRISFPLALWTYALLLSNPRFTMNWAVGNEALSRKGNQRKVDHLPNGLMLRIWLCEGSIKHFGCGEVRALGHVILRCVNSIYIILYGVHAVCVALSAFLSIPPSGLSGAL